MARGFLAGAALGVVVSAVGAGGLSLVMDAPPAPGDLSDAAPVADAATSSAVPEEMMTEAPEAVAAAEPMEPVESEPASETDVIVPETPDIVLETPSEEEVAEQASGTAPVTVVDQAPDILPEAEAQTEEMVSVEVADAPDVLGDPSPITTLPQVDETPDADVESATMPAEEAPEETAGNEEDAPENAPENAQFQMAGSLIDRREEAPGRLPSIAAIEAGAAGEASVTAEDLTQGFANLSPDSPLVQYAVPFTPEAGVPRMAIILIDDGTVPIGPEELATFPFPVTFAIPPGHEEAAATAQAYRKNGFEVLALGEVPSGATASDVEVTLSGLFDAVPEAVGVLEAPEGGLQGSRDVSTQATEYLEASGHGLVMTTKGLNTAQKLASKAGVPAVSLFRDLDGEGQDQDLIRRALDQAAFRARQEGYVVMLGRVRPSTISAVLLWGLQDRGAEITLVPISTVLRESAL